MPPPVPFFSGRHLSAAETDGLLALRPLRGHAFTAPAGTGVLYLPIVTLVDVAVRRGADPAWSSVDFAGDFKRTNYPAITTLAPVASDDADALVQAMRRRHGLPRVAREVSPTELRGLPALELISVVGTYRPGHCEAPDFEGVSLSTPNEKPRLTPGARYRVTGFFYPAPPPPPPDMPHIVGYGGPRLTGLAIVPAD